MRRINKSQSTSGFRRVFFTAVDTLDLQSRITQAEMGIGGAGSFTIKISKNGASPATPSGTSITEVSTSDFKGLNYLTLAAADLDTPGVLLIKISSSGGSKVMEPREIEIDVVEYDGYNAVRGTAGTALPNAAAEAAGGLYTRGTGAGQINQAANGQVDVKVVAGDFLTTLGRIAGLLHENAMVDNVVYGTGNVITSARIRVFANAAALAAATPGASNNTDNEVYRYSISCDDSPGGGQYESFEIARSL